MLLASLGAHLWGITHDLPVPEVDERYFVRPAAYMAANGTWNPHWFGHPGSTVIYPLAAIFRAREVLFHGGPLTGASPSIARRLRTDTESFLLIGRFLALLAGVAAIPVVFAIGRKVFDDVTGLAAAAIWAVAPLAVRYGQVTRTDSVGLLVALLTLLLCLRALEVPTTARFAAAGVMAGLGVATRYFLVALAVVIVATAIMSGPARRLRHAGVALGAMAMTFVLTTPYLVLDFARAWPTVRQEASPGDARQTSGFVANLAFYLVHAIPGGVSWVVFPVALAGLVLTVRSLTPGRTLLLVWLGTLVLGVSAVSFHWDRWILPALPVVALLAAHAVVTAARRLGASARGRWRSRSWFVPAATVVLVLGVMVAPAASVVRADLASARPSTRYQAQMWLEHHVAPADGVASEVNGPDLTDTAFRFVEHHALPQAGSLAQYAAAGFRYLVVNHNIARQYLGDAAGAPSEAAFYRYLRTHVRRAASFHPTSTRDGAPLTVYDLGPDPTALVGRPDLPGGSRPNPSARARDRVLASGAIPVVECALRRLAATPRHPAPRCVTRRTG